MVPVSVDQEVPLAGADPIRVFSWVRSQRHRPGLQYMNVPTTDHGEYPLSLLRIVGTSERLRRGDRAGRLTIVGTVCSR
jgi:hypothetical protein